MSQVAARFLFAIGLSIGVVQAGCGTSPTKSTPSDTPASSTGAAFGGGALDRGLTSVTLQLNWFPEAEHGGFYAALVKGYYREAGLDVRILPGGPDTPVLQQVARRAATFGVVNADNILFGRAQEAPVVALMAPLQTSPRCLIVHESSRIRDFNDLKNMTIAMSSNNAFSHFLRHKVSLEGVKIVPYSGNVAQFLLNADYAQQGYVFSEPFVARKQGGDPKVLMLSDLGFNPYTSLLFTHDAQLKEGPEIVGKMVAASIRGWAKYIESPDDANGAIHRANPEMGLDILAFGAQKLRPLVLDPVAEQQGIGTMSFSRWQTLADQLVETDQLKSQEVHVEQAFTTEFLPSK
ncbi:MAG: ABC transporter substrate-binding protein [Planctomycetia bacterium]|nr:ABC transporter substrate-binding protein [Planctomycetia bacterium]